MVTHPGEYRWSSYAAKGEKNLVVDFDPLYLALGSNENERQAAYAVYVLGTVPDNELGLIHESPQRGETKQEMNGFAKKFPYDLAFACQTRARTPEKSHNIK